MNLRKIIMLVLTSLCIIIWGFCAFASIKDILPLSVYRAGFTGVSIVLTAAFILDLISDIVD